MTNVKSISAQLCWTCLGIWCAFIVTGSSSHAQDFYSVSQAPFDGNQGFVKQVQPVQGTVSFRDFYKYISTDGIASSDPSAGVFSLLQCQTTTMFLYKDTTKATPGLYFFIVHNKFAEQCKPANVSMQQVAIFEFVVPETDTSKIKAMFVVRDDEDDRVVDCNDGKRKLFAFQPIENGIKTKVRVSWNWPLKQTDGAVFGPIPENYTFKISAQYIPLPQSTNKLPWQALFHNGSQLNTPINFAMPTRTEAVCPFDEPVSVYKLPAITVSNSEPILVVTPADTVKFLKVECSESKPALITLRNAGLTSLQLDSIKLKLNTSHFALSPDLPALPKSLAPEESLKFSIQFNAVALGRFEDELQIFSNDPRFTNPLLPFRLPLLATVDDTTKPSFTKLPTGGLIVACATSGDSALISFADSVKVEDACDPNPKLVFSILRSGRIITSPAFFQDTGDTGTAVVCQATDDSNNDTTRIFAVIVRQSGQVKFSPDSVDFGTVECNTSAKDSVKLINLSACPLRIDSVKIKSRRGFTLLTPLATPQVINPMDSLALRLVVEFFAKSVKREYDDSLLVYHDSLNQPAILKLKAFSDDTTAPTIVCPDPITVCATTSDGGRVVFALEDSSDACGINSVAYFAIRKNSGDKEDSTQTFSGTNFPLGSTAVSCVVEDSSGNKAYCRFDVIVEELECKLTVTSPLGGQLTTCDNSALLEVRVDAVNFGQRLTVLEWKINGTILKAPNGANITTNPLSTTVALKDDNNGINAFDVQCRVQNANQCSTACGTVITITKEKSQPGIIVINEILYDPRGPDLGFEQIELRNSSDTSNFNLKDLALWFKTDQQEVFWKFPDEDIMFLPGQLLVVNWLAKGDDDQSRLVFNTGVPDKNHPDQDRFFFDNPMAAPDSTELRLGGTLNVRSFAFAIVKDFDPNNLHQAREFCQMVDFIQFGNTIPGIEQSAVQDSLWLPGNAIGFGTGQGNCADEEGFSYEYNEDNNLRRPQKRPENYFKQARPSLGELNLFENTPPSHLLISEICVKPDFAEFIEIFNPTDSTRGPDGKKKPAIALDGYYLTDSGGLTAADGKVLPNNYTNIVYKDLRTLHADAGDFIVHFPAGDSIAPQHYKTIALNTAKFIERYSRPPNYEIVLPNMTGYPEGDPGVANLVIDAFGGDTLKLDDNHEEVIIFNWVEQHEKKSPNDKASPEPDSSDIVKDVDYVVWGDTSLIAVDKTKLKIDGIDRNADSTSYKADTRRSLQRPIATQPHFVLKSWQRRQIPRELGENCGSGNGISGDNETSENLALAFQQAPPTPGARTGELDLQAALIVDQPRSGGRFGKNGVVNPFEEIRMRLVLKNIGDESTGSLYTILRTSDPATIGVLEGGKVQADTSTFLPIPGKGGVDTSLSQYVFLTKDTYLPDLLRFTLFVIEKPGGNFKNEVDNVFAVAAAQVGVAVEVSGFNAYIRLDAKTVEATIRGTDSLEVKFKIRNDLQEGNTGDPADSVSATVTNIFNPSDPRSVISGFRVSERPLLSIPRGDSSSMKLTFNLRKQNFTGTPVGPFIVQFGWKCNNCGEVRKMNDDTLSFAERVNTFVVDFKLGYFGDTTKSIQNAIVRVERCGKIVDEIRRGPNGRYRFSRGKRDAGEYKFSVVHPVGVPIDAITDADIEQATTYTNPPASGPSRTVVNTNLEIFKRIAANVNGDNLITGTSPTSDVELIRKKLPSSPGSPRDSCLVFPVGKNWTFIDASPGVSVERFYEAPESISLVLGHYNSVNLNFAGIVYGDIMGDANFGTTTVPCGVKRITGKITYFSPVGLRVPAVEFKLPLGMSARGTVRNSDSTYAITNISADSFYTLTPFKSGNLVTNGINAIEGTDLNLITTLLDNRITPTGFQFLASDVNCNNKFETNDKEVLDYYLRTTPKPDTGQVAQWRFIRRPINFDAADRNHLIQDYVAVLGGDTNGSWGGAGGVSKAHSNAGIYPFLSDVKLAPGEQFTLPLRLGSVQALVTASFNLEFDAKQLAMVRIEKNKILADYNLEHKLIGGSLQASLWRANSSNVATDDIGFITFRAIGQVGDSSLLILKDFSVNQEVNLQATARIKLVKKVPEQFFLTQNYPNPFNPTTRIKYGLPKDEQVRFEIFNIVGQVVLTVMDKRQEAGYYDLEWNGTDHNGRNVPTGVYFIRMKAGQFLQVRKLTVLR